MASLEMQRLKTMYNTGLLNIDEFLRMSKDLQQIGESSGAPQQQHVPSEGDEEEELLVGEDGEPLKSPARSLSAHSDHDSVDNALGGVFSPSHSPLQTPDESRSTSPTTRPADGPAAWRSGLVVWSTDLKCEVTFVRLGGPNDFVNSSRAKISFVRVKPGKVRVTETVSPWVRPESLQLLTDEDAVPDTPAPNVTTERRVSPRLADRETTTRSADLPGLAAHERGRKLPMKQAAPVRGHNKATVLKTKESKVSVEQRITEFPDHSLSLDKMTGKLRCDACGILLINLKQTIKTHTSLGTATKPSAHAQKLQIWRTRSQDDTALKEDLLAYFEAHPDEKVGTTDADTLLYRFRAAESFVKTPPFTGIDHHHHLLQRAGHSLPASAHLGRFIPKIEAAEIARLKGELEGQHIGIAFDGTTRLGEAINTTARWCGSDFQINMRLLDISTLEKHVNNIDLAAHEVEVTRLRGIPAARIVNIARDSCSVNGAACRRLLITFTSAVDTLCFSHTLCHVGEHFELATLVEFKTPWLELAGGRNPHHGAKALWKRLVEVPVPGYSHVRWWAWAEILFVIAEAGMKLLGDFISTSEEREYGDATTRKLRAIYDEKGDALRLELAAMLDMRILVTTTYELEGDRLELLLTYDRVEALRALGRSLKAGGDGVLPNVDAVLRRLMVLKKGVKVEKYFNGHGICSAKLEKKEKVDSTLYPGTEREAWLIKYNDSHEEHFEEEELRSGKHGGVPSGQDGKPVLVVRDLRERKDICDGLVPGFEYLEARITGTCGAQYSLVTMYELCDLVRVFDPNFAAAHANPALIDRMSVITPLNALDMLDGMKRELPLYLAAAANSPTFDKGSVADYTDAILGWWRANGSSFKAWALAARIVFAISPNSASCERVFSVLERLFGDQQLSSLSDLLQASLMLNYNKRVVG